MSIPDFRGRGGSYRERSRGRGRGFYRGRGSGPWIPPSGGPVQTPAVSWKPIGLRKLQEMKEKSPSEVVFILRSETSGFREMLKEVDMFREKRLAAWAVIALACRCEHKQNLRDFLKLVNDSADFTLRGLHKYLSTVQTGWCQPDDASTLDNITNFLECLQLMHPSTSLTTLSLLLPILKGAVKSRLTTFGQGLLDRLNRLEDRRADMEKRYSIEFEKPARASAPDEPSNNFREIPIVPDSSDVVKNVRPFLRPNIVDGKYKDVDHYLDVQFRLLREDYVRPLREVVAACVEQIRQGNGARLHQRKVYSDVVVVQKRLTEGGVFHVIQFHVTGFLQRINWENSKRLIFGSLLCFTSDNFQTLHFATVVYRDPEKVKEGLLCVRFEHKDLLEIEKDYSKTYIMIETDSYFEAYRHVLTVLQEISVDTFPLKEYIVSLEKQVKPPEYTSKDDLVYCFQNVLDTNETLPSKDYFARLHIRLGVDETRKLYHCPCPGRKVNIHNETEWSSLDLGLDDSQLKAVKSALTQSISIIQGPPGTGKTFVGLKVMQFLLHNRRYWSPVEDPCPIVVVCYTNHALDQFLEGILKTTTKIVRIGGRGKSEALSSFNLNVLRNHAIESRFHDYTYRARLDVEGKMHDIAAKIGSIEKKMKQSNTEVLLLEELVEEMSNEHVESLQKDFPKYLPSSFKANMLFGFWLGIEVQEGASGVPELPEEVKPIQQTEKEDVMNAHDLDEDEIDITKPYEYVGEAMDEAEPCETQELSFQTKDPVYVPEQTMVVAPEINTEQPKIQIRGDFPDQITEFTAVVNIEELNNAADVEYLTEQRMVSADYQIPRDMLAPATGDEENVIPDVGRDGWQTQGGRKQLKKLIYKRLKCSPMNRSEADSCKNIWSLHPEERWRLYKFWLAAYTERNKANVQKYGEELETLLIRLNEVNQERERLIVNGAHVVGLTTTGAAKYNHLIRGMKSKIVIVEEAAEVLEAHIVTALSKNTQHLILIGDHQQLRPNPTVYELGKKYNLEISLFERLIQNGLPYCTLRIQHRMKPCISKLLVPNIYKELVDHESVSKYEDVKGMEKSMFFVKHTVQEYQANDSTSRVNTHEIDFLLELCRYLLLQGYHPSRITILTTYLAQFFLLKKSLVGTLKEVKVTVVDNFQGEENDIILLSFVRSNEEGAIGFLKTDNRVCVALSRAKHGLYCVGNFDLLAEQSPLWRKITQQLEEHGAIGTTMNVKCQNHRKLVPVETANDFSQISDGGCLEPCDFRLPCGHVCARKCHPDDKNHKQYLCEKSCEKTLCDMKHQCPKHCFEQCGDCSVPVEKVIPSCQHKALVPCFKNPNSYTCQFPCTKILTCGHSCPKICGAICGDCPVLVNIVAPCGHQVRVRCCLSTECKKLLTYCLQGCEKLLSCGHKCTKLCGEECTEDCSVLLKRTLRCGHAQNVQCCQITADDRSHWITASTKYSLDPRACNILSKVGPVLSSGIVLGGELQDSCGVACRKELECGHQCRGSCGACVQGRIHITCEEPCGRILSCGHPCSYFCAVSCPPCIHPCNNHCVHSRCQLPCGYPCVPCKEPCAWRCKHLQCRRLCCEPCDRPPCNRPCTKKLRCGHKCIGMCGEPCPGKCRVCHRAEVTAIFFGDEDHPLAIFVELEDCGHIFEIRGFTRWINDQQEDTSEIKLISCPLCRTPLRKNMRFNAAVKKTVLLIEQIKRKFFGAMEHNINIQEKLKSKLRRDMSVCYNVFGSYSLMENVSNRISDTSTDPLVIEKAIYEKLSGMEYVYDSGTLSLYENYVKFADENKLIVTKVASVSSPSIKASIDPIQQIRNFTGHTLQSINRKLMENLNRSSDQLLDDILWEFRRLNLAAQFLEFSEQALGPSNLEVNGFFSHGINVLLSYAPFREEQHRELVEIQTKMKKLFNGTAVLGVSDVERLSIMKAMGLKQGHWYQCPNGHVYCITECGGAMVEGRCNECNATIGGGSHRLRGDNRVSTAMDGARHSAWSEQANMGNYDFDRI